MKTSLYRHFGSKDGLVVAVIERHTDVWTRNWLQSEIERRGKTPAKQLLAIFDAFDDWFHEEPFEGCLFINTLTESHHYATPVRDAALAALTEIRALIADLALAAGVRDAKTFAQRLQILMWARSPNALQGNRNAAKDARSIAELFLARNSPRGASRRRLFGRLDDDERVPVGVAHPEHRRHRVAVPGDLLVDVDAGGLQRSVICFQV